MELSAERRATVNADNAVMPEVDVAIVRIVMQSRRRRMTENDELVACIMLKEGIATPK